jgi:low affinity Fe/Cu permease
MIMKSPNHEEENGVHDEGSLLQAKRSVDAQPETVVWRLRETFHRFSQKASTLAGTPWAFFAALLSVAVWALLGRRFGYSDTWQLVINTGTTIVTFLMVFLIQNTQNRDAKAIHLKLDELIRAKRGARNTLLDLQNCTDAELREIEEEFKRLRERAARHPEHAQDVGRIAPPGHHPPPHEPARSPHLPHAPHHSSAR